jgi:hypothetical protein
MHSTIFHWLVIENKSWVFYPRDTYSIKSIHILNLDRVPNSNLGQRNGLAPSVDGWKGGK